jgi:bZIP transcription factor
MAMSTAETRVDGTRTPSPQGPFGSFPVGGNSSEVEVPSPVPASISSTTSSDPSLSQHGGTHHHHMYAVPNPFTAIGAPGPSTTGPVGWGSHTVETGAPAPAGYAPHPRAPHAHYQPQGPIPMVVSAHAPAPPPSYHPHAMAPTPSTDNWSRLNSCPNFSIGSTDPKSPSSAAGGRGAKATGSRRRYNTKASVALVEAETIFEEIEGVGDSVNARRQKRLERNRESARLSRRRRKHYLEILEERVTHLSTELDSGRRAHASQAVTVVLNKRREVLEAPEFPDQEKIRILEQGLGRNSAEMMLVTTFKHQQLKSFSLPPQSKFVLWLTLQNDQYFRGGRAASERLSAARIGERVSRA